MLNGFSPKGRVLSRCLDRSKGKWSVLIDSVHKEFAKITLHELRGLYFDERMFKADQKH